MEYCPGPGPDVSPVTGARRETREANAAVGRGGATFLRLFLPTFGFSATFEGRGSDGIRDDVKRDEVLPKAT